LGFKAYGYSGFHLDDCWSNIQRNATGFVQAELDHFPNGMKPVVDYVHAHKLDFGLYTSAGSETCVGGRPGSKGHWQQDADVFAEWGVDWVKQDNCNTKGMGKPESYFPLMSAALNKTGRPICFAMCEWGKDDPWNWGGKIAQSWRMHGDHTGNWQSTKNIIAASAAVPAEKTGRPYAWNDMDMLETGNYAQAAHATGKESHLTAPEYRTEFSMWAISASPMVVTTPIMNCSAGHASSEPHPAWVLAIADAQKEGGEQAACTIALKRQTSQAPCIKGKCL
jgi:alpha-galactosidase